ncbi:MAG: TonB-dependent receptor [Ignavibacteriales bacterium]|nr:TonB-dependent receptor [Ignavibacteriales bacterium]
MHRKLIYFMLFLSLSAMMFASTKGRIRGQVVDIQTGEPLIGANVVVVGTNFGAATDASGTFVLMNLEAGSYDIQVSYIGYQTITMTGIRVNADLTTEITVELPSIQYEVPTVVVQAVRPLIIKDATSSVQVTTNEEIQNLPVRGMTNIIALNAGVVDYNGIHLRGSREDEVAYYLDGVSIKNPMGGGRLISVPNDAIEEVQVETGGYSAEYGDANGGIIRSSLRTGSNEYRASVEIITDNIAFKSKEDFYNQEEELGRYWYGYNELSAVLSGPIIPNSKVAKFFLNFNYIYDKDRSKRGYSGFDYGYFGDGLDANPIQNDSLNLIYPQGVLKNNSAQQYGMAGTITLDLNPVTFKLGGTYFMRDYEVGSNGIGALDRAMTGKQEIDDGVFSLKMTHVLSPSMFYEITGGMTFYKSEQGTPGIWDDYWKYGDSVKIAEALGGPWYRTDKQIENSNIGRYRTPSVHTIFGWSFVNENSIPATYGKQDRNSWSIGGKFTYLIGKTHEIKIGGDYKQHTIRNWTAGNQTQFAANIAADMYRKGYIASRNDDIWTALASHPAYEDSIKKILLYQGGVINYGYDVLGNEVDDDVWYAPKKPVTAGFYIEDKIEYQDIILKLGARYDYFDIDNKKMVDPTMPEKSIGGGNDGTLIESGWEQIPARSYISPRVSLSFPVTDRTVFHAGFGKFIQMPNLDEIYNGYHYWAYQIAGGFFFSNPNAMDLEPIRKTHYAIGFRQELTDFLAFDITAYYDDVKGQIYFDLMNTDVAGGSKYQSYTTKANGDFQTSKGIELSFTMRRYHRLMANASFTFQDAKGTGSYPNSNSGVVGAPLDGVTIFRPKYISPLEFNRDFSGTINLDYRFGENDGPVSMLHQFGVNLLLTVNSGHPFTRGVGGANMETDGRDRRPIEPLGASTTPSQFRIDLKIDKTFKIYDRLAANFYIKVLNLLNNQNVNDVYRRSGAADDDGYISNPELGGTLINTYGPIYEQLYRDFVINYNGFYGQARQIILGFRLEY